MSFNINNPWTFWFGVIVVAAWAGVNIWIAYQSFKIKKRQNELQDKLLDNQMKQADLQAQTQKSINEQNNEIQKLIENNKRDEFIENHKHEIEMKRFNQTTKIYSSLISNIENALSDFAHQVQLECSPLTAENYLNHQFSDEWQKAKINLVTYLPSALKIISAFENDITHKDLIQSTLGNIDPLTSETFQLILSKRIAELVADIRQAILEIQIGTNSQQSGTCS
ncbi:hypothetical protein [Ligilactobacillus sp. 110_WCHN]|uniref:hypothetical protein n=1 Tax=Ligilactobacillus sp. 110_WCHN TaxID=3057125 RepID=UPI002672E71B|nr:hypothetical protein [Ligilactobacillus sp. 110_WCHN]MDO3393920.1 hypothetical protein [Ligilactobacillus sp. 110_WCHN]